jgi:type III secretory pathway component EscU
MLSKARRGTPKAKEKVRQTMHEFKQGALHSGSKQGPMVRNRKQAVAIALSQARKAK